MKTNKPDNKPFKTVDIGPDGLNGLLKPGDEVLVKRKVDEVTVPGIESPCVICEVTHYRVLDNTVKTT